MGMRKPKNAGELQRVGAMWVDRHIMANMTSLVDALMKCDDRELSDEFSYDNIERTEVTTAKCKVCGVDLEKDSYGWCDADGNAEIDDIEEDEEAGIEWKEGHEHEPDIDEDEDGEEYYHWYLVDSSTAGWLQEHGESILRTCYGDFWGRQCSGQAIYIDSVIEKIASELAWIEDPDHKE